MELNIHKIRIFTKDTEESLQLKKDLAKKLISHNYEIVENDFDLGIAIGGDGTFLRMIHTAGFDSNAYYIGINTGTLGFAQELRVDQIDEFLDSLKNGVIQLEEIGIQETTITTASQTFVIHSLNEIVIREEHLKSLTLDVIFNNELLEKFTGDGILIATSFGSTAYNASLGGSIIDPSFHTLQITPIAPLNSKAYRNLLNSFIIPENKTITFIPKSTRSSLLLVTDGFNKTVRNVQKIETVVKDKRVLCLRLPNYNFIKKINDKLIKG